MTGFVVELEKDVWLVAVDADPSRTLVLANAMTWPTERAALRALQKARKLSRISFRNAKVYQIKGDGGGT